MEKLRPQYSVGALAEALEVSKSGFHAHRHKPARPRRQRDAALRPLIAASFARSRQTYGCRRVRADLADLGQRCGKHRIARLMRLQRPGRKLRGDLKAEALAGQIPPPTRPPACWSSTTSRPSTTRIAATAP